ncbi:hypothetical protein AVEN_215647-1 [Araneus ventricosus]|uniref:Uncharacterized protein n=1 Tax=Araneus ventricosus TaxID=182803 RepID=A0A4Y2X455_ARAVE|nr:hypothetical protein AVEN_215647-1 [Araneus ventricosus]
MRTGPGKLAGSRFSWELGYLPPVIVCTSYGRDRAWPSMATRTQVLLIKLLQRLSFSACMPRQNRCNYVYGCGNPTWGSHRRAIQYGDEKPPCK